MQIAIDGPVASGKSTISYLLSKKLGILYIDTGAMYRAVALTALQQKIPLENEEKIVDLVTKTRIELKIPGVDSKHKCLVFVNKKDVSDKIRTPQISRATSLISVLPKVRKEMVIIQKRIAKGQGVVMEGRDITTKVLPDADLKIFLTAQPVIRAKRRQKELKREGSKVNFREVLEETIERDKRDSTRKTDPLTITKDSWVLDTTNLTINQVVNKILEKVKNLK